MLRRHVLIALAAASGLTLAGCSSGGNAADDGAEQTIKIMTIESLTGSFALDDTAAKGTKAAADSINADGGVNGITIEVISCDSASDPNKSAECARDAVDEGVVAVIGSFDPLGAQNSIEVLESAGIPWLSAVPISQVEYTSEIAFPTTAGASAAQFGLVGAAQELDCTAVGTWGDRSSDPTTQDALNGAIEAAGMKLSYADIPLTTADVTPAVQQVLEDDPDCLAYGAANTIAAQVFTAAKRAGSDAQFISAYQTILPPLVTSLGDVVEGMVAVSDTPLLTDDALKPFMDDMAEYSDVPEEKLSSFPLYSWYGVQLLAEYVLPDLGSDVTAETVLEKLKTLDNIELPGLPSLSFTEETDSEVYPRMFNTRVAQVKVENGVYVGTDADWLDISSYLP